MTTQNKELEELRKERWRDIKGYEGLYKISDHGRVRSLIGKGRIMKLATNFNGYYFLSLRKNGQKKFAKVSRLVAMAFISNPKNKPNVNHIDGIRNNNNVKNLEWCTQSENAKHAFKIGNHSQVGSRNAASKLTESKVREIKKLAKIGITYTRIAKTFKVSLGAISHIMNKRDWKHVI